MKIMKNFKYIMGVALLLCTTSCDDFLNVPPVDLLTSDGFYETPTQINQGVVGMYTKLRDISMDEYLYMSECRSDNSWVIPRDNAIRQYSEIGTFRANQELAEFNSVWNLWYSIIYNANVLITEIPDCDFGTETVLKDQFLGEAHFMRGWAYFELARLYGNIPLIDVPMSSAQVQTIEQSPASEIYSKIIIPDLKLAKSKLPLMADMKDATGASISTKGRADRIAATALLGRVYMTLNGFPHNDATAQGLAEAELKEVITFSENNGNKYWAPDSTEWRKQWIPTKEYYNKYSLFSIQHRGGGTGNKATFYFGPNLPNSYTTYNLFGNTIHVEKSLMYEFDKIYNSTGEELMDARGYNHSILAGYDAEDNFPAYSQIKDKLTLEDGSVVDVLTTSMYYKFMPSLRKVAELNMSVDVESTMTGSNDWPVNHPVIRYDDVLLMYAEILAAKNDITGAMKIVNDIRERVGCDPASASTAAEALKLVKRERRVEFMGEGVRWFDLVRWNDWQSAITSMFDRYNNPDGTDKNDVKNGRYLYPIPLNQLNAKPGLYKQNDDY